MAWAAVGTPFTPNNQWQFTAPVEGEFFRLKHTRSPNEPKAWICQAEKLEDDSYQIFDVQPIHANNPTESFQLKKPAIFTSRCVGFRYAVDYNSPWRIALEVSDIKTSSTSDTSNNPQPNAGDSNFDKVVLLCHFDGANNSVNFIDVKEHPITPFGNAIISTNQSKFGGASAYFDGNGDYLEFATNPDFDLANSDFTLESCVYPTLSGQTTIIERRGNGFGVGDWVVFYNNGRIELAAYDIDSGGNAILASSAGDTPSNTWTYFAIGRNNNTWKLFINGITKDTKNYTQTIANNNQPLTIGRDTPGGGRFYYGGYVDELRLSKVARYTSDFTPPLTAFPNSN